MTKTNDPFCTILNHRFQEIPSVPIFPSLGLTALWIYNRPMSVIIPVASGKGGVGKSTVTANLAIALARSGRTVAAVDLDLGASNLHTCLGVRNTGDGVATFLLKKEQSLLPLLVETDYPGLRLLPGDGLIPGTMNIPFYIKRKLLQGLTQLPFDYILLDLSAGSSTNTLDFFLLSPLGLIVTLPETTALLNAYAFLKAAAFRFLNLSFPAKSSERDIIEAFMTQKIESSGKNMLELVGQLAALNPASGARARQALERFHPGVIINMGKGRDDLSIGVKLREIVRKNLTTDVTYMAYLPWEESARTAINARKPLSELSPGSGFVKAISQLAAQISQVQSTDQALFWEGSDDDWGQIEALSASLNR